MVVTIIVNNCFECTHAGHSGAFTKGGSISICEHRNSPREEIEGVKDWRDIKTKEIAESVFNQRKINDTMIPVWCPVQNGYSY